MQSEVRLPVKLHSQGLGSGIGNRRSGCTGCITRGTYDFLLYRFLHSSTTTTPLSHQINSSLNPTTEYIDTDKS